MHIYQYKQEILFGAQFLFHLDSEQHLSPPLGPPMALEIQVLGTMWEMVFLIPVSLPITLMSELTGCEKQ